MGVINIMLGKNKYINHVHANLRPVHEVVRVSRVQPGYPGPGADRQNSICAITKQLLKALKDDTSPYMVGLKQEYKPTIGLNSTLIN